MTMLWQIQCTFSCQINKCPLKLSCDNGQKIKSAPFFRAKSILELWKINRAWLNSNDPLKWSWHTAILKFMPSLPCIINWSCKIWKHIPKTLVRQSINEHICTAYEQCSEWKIKLNTFFFFSMTFERIIYRMPSGWSSCGNSGKWKGNCLNVHECFGDWRQKIIPYNAKTIGHHHRPSVNKHFIWNEILKRSIIVNSRSWRYKMLFGALYWF